MPVTPGTVTLPDSHKLCGVSPVFSSPQRYPSSECNPFSTLPSLSMACYGHHSLSGKGTPCSSSFLFLWGNILTKSSFGEEGGFSCLPFQVLGRHFGEIKAGAQVAITWHSQSRVAVTWHSQSRVETEYKFLLDRLMLMSIHLSSLFVLSRVSPCNGAAHLQLLSISNHYSLL